MIAERAKTIGRIQATKAVSLGLAIAYLLMAGLSGEIAWLGHVRYWPNLIFAAVAMYGCAYFYGGWAGTAILQHNRKAWGAGILYGLLTLVTVPFLASWVGFFQEGFAKVGTNDNPFIDYLAKPVILVSEFGLLPATLVGIWFGNSIKQAGER